MQKKIITVDRLYINPSSAKIKTPATESSVDLVDLAVRNQKRKILHNFQSKLTFGLMTLLAMIKFFIFIIAFHFSAFRS